MGFQSHEGGWVRQVPLELFEIFMCFFSPLELILLFEELEEGEPPDAESRDESAQGSHATY
jgi:hypothetical protein